MTKIPSEIVPISADADILAFCQQLVPGATPIVVPIQPWSKATPSECFDNVAKYVSDYGGQRLLGWRPMRWANIMVEVEAHAVWQSPTGEFLDITPFEQSASLFLPDPDMEYIGYPHPNRRQALTKSPLIAELISKMDQLDELKSNVKSGTNCEVPVELCVRIHEINQILHKADIGRNDLCPCQSGLKFKKCCGRF